MGMPGVEFFDWTESTVIRLKSLWADGLTAGQISNELGATRNAVIGKVHRLGLAGRARPPSPKKTVRVKSERIAPFRAPKPPRYAAPKPHAETSGPFECTEIVDLLPDTDIPVEQRRTILTIERHQCRWPVGDPTSSDFFFCGGDVAIRSDGARMAYCPNHCLRAFDTARTRSSRRDMSDDEKGKRRASALRRYRDRERDLASA